MGNPGWSWLRASIIALLVLPLFACAINVDPFEVDAKKAKDEETEDADGTLLGGTTGRNHAGGGDEPAVGGTGTISQLGFLLLLVTGVTAFFALLLGTRAIKMKERKPAKKMVVVPAEEPAQAKPATEPKARAS